MKNKERWTDRNARAMLNKQHTEVDKLWDTFDIAQKSDHLRRESGHDPVMYDMLNKAHDKYYEYGFSKINYLDENVEPKIDQRIAYEKTIPGKLSRKVNEIHDDSLVAVRQFKSNWKIGAAAISDSAKKGADFVKSLFK